METKTHIEADDEEKNIEAYHLFQDYENNKLAEEISNIFCNGEISNVNPFRLTDMDIMTRVYENIAKKRYIIKLAPLGTRITSCIDVRAGDVPFITNNFKDEFTRELIDALILNNQDNANSSIVNRILREAKLNNITDIVDLLYNASKAAIVDNLNLPIDVDIKDIQKGILNSLFAFISSARTQDEDVISTLKNFILDILKTKKEKILNEFLTTMKRINNVDINHLLSQMSNQPF